MTVDVSDARAVLGEAVRLHEAGAFSDAIPFYIRAVKLAPNDPEVLHATGIALGQANKPAEAVKHLYGALSFGKNTPEVWNALGMAFVDLRKLGNAERCFRQVIRMDPQCITGWINYGNFAYAAGQPDIGAKRFDQAILPKAKNAGDKFAQALIWLLRGHWRLGWRGYEARRMMGNWLMRNRQQATLKATPLGLAGIRKGQRILIEAEQGQGDAVMMARFVQPFADAYGVSVVLQSHNALVDAMQGALPGIEVVGRTVIPEADGWLPMMSLPFYLEVASPRSVPAPVPMFGSPWSVPQRGDGKFRVFLHTRGNAAHSYDFDRTVPSASVLAPLSAMPNVEVVQAPFRQEVDANGVTILHEPTWRETVDLLRTCDRCLTVDTGLAHMAASLGVPTDIIIPTMPEWRWGLGKETSVWYPSARLWRRATTDAWSEVVAAITTHYRGLCPTS